MKIRSLLLGSAAILGLSTAGYAADLGVVTSLDVCDELGLSGLTISSADNCLVITGSVEFAYNVGDYDSASTVNAWNLLAGGDKHFIDPTGGDLDHSAEVTAKLGFVATASSDFGPASAHITLKTDYTGSTDAYVLMDEAYVQIGDTTVLMAGKKGSIFEKGDDEPLNWLGLFNSSIVDAGVGEGSTGMDHVAKGDLVIQGVTNLGNGFSIGGGLEDLADYGTAVGVMKYAGDNVTAHASFAIGDLYSSVGTDPWQVHAGVTASMDNFKFVAAAYFDNSGPANGTYYNVLASASATFDMFTIAGSFEGDGDSSGSQWGAGGSVSAAVADGVTLNLGGRYWKNAASESTTQVAAGVTAAVTETITATAELGYVSETEGGGANLTYAKGSLAWAPGGGFTSSIALEANSNSAYKATFKAAKTIK